MKLSISSLNVTKPKGPADLVTFTEEILNGKLHFLSIKIFEITLFLEKLLTQKGRRIFRVLLV